MSTMTPFSLSIWHTQPVNLRPQYFNMGLDLVMKSLGVGEDSFAS